MTALNARASDHGFANRALVSCTVRCALELDAATAPQAQPFVATINAGF
jgi:hypothetical protein